jgi:hypothetical protein
LTLDFSELDLDHVGAISELARNLAVKLLPPFSFQFSTQPNEYWSRNSNELIN